LALAETRATEYADKLRQARGEVFKLREARIKQWNAERDAALDVARKAAALQVSQAKAALEAEAALARQAIQASAGDLARQVVRAVLPVAAGGSR
jgi:F-type H+-transporting ATPase subunit b